MLRAYLSVGLAWRSSAPAHGKAVVASVILFLLLYLWEPGLGWILPGQAWREAGGLVRPRPELPFRPPSALFSRPHPPRVPLIPGLSWLRFPPLLLPAFR